jgi:hypothetical protein
MRYLLVLLLVGCASPTWDWHKPGADYQAERDACNAQVPASALFVSPALSGQSKSDECMMKKGWEKKPRLVPS